jgi:hypothetical protein
MRARDRLASAGEDEVRAILAQRAEKGAFMRQLEPQLDPGIRAALRWHHAGPGQDSESQPWRVVVPRRGQGVDLSPRTCEPSTKLARLPTATAPFVPAARPDTP